MSCISTLLILYHSLFLSPLLQVPQSSFAITNMLYIEVCIWSYVFVYMFIFWIYLPHKRENMWLLSFWTWLTSLNMISSSCTHLPSNHEVSFFLMAK
jgi:hypothetical protein